MLRKKIENGGLTECIYASSTILASTYNKENKDLTVIFNNGGSYTYSAVKGTDYLRFEIDDSQGRILNSHIKQYPFTNNGKIDVTLIKEQLEVAVTEEKANIAKDMLDSMRTVLSLYDEEGMVDLPLLNDVEAGINLFKKINKLLDEEK